MNCVPISLGDRSYEMQIGSGILKEMLGDITDRAMFVVDDKVMPLLGDKITVGSGQGLLTMFASEMNKTMPSVEKIWESLSLIIFLTYLSNF